LPRNIAGANGIQTSTPADLEAALAAWLDLKIAAGISYKDLHDDLEGMALRHLLRRFDNKPTVLARETKMNRVTLRKKCRFLQESD
jgi:hypothetical protein